ncbi:MAG: GyrI-like domain-containing protein [Dehalococcoidia bacterium]
MPYVIEEKEVQPQLVVTIRVTTSELEIGSSLGDMITALWLYVVKAGVRPAGMPFARYHQFHEGSVDFEAGIPVAEPVPGEGQITAGELPGGRVAATWHVGPYENLPEAYQALEAWFKEHGREIAGVPWEIFWAGPVEVQDPSQWETEVLWPIE